jgi:hypothetical protein
MTRSRLSVLAIAVAAVIVVAVLSVPMARMVSGGRGAAAAPQAAVQHLPALPPATTQSINAVDSYFEAIRLMHELTSVPADSARFDRYDNGHFDDQAGAFFASHGQIVSWVRQGAGSPSCDWGQPTIAQHLPELNGMRPIARFTHAHARYAAQQKDLVVATDDILAEMGLARHVGTNPLLVDKLVEIGIETFALDEMAKLLPSMPADQLKALPQRLDALPASTTGKQMIQGEHDTVLRIAREQKQYLQILALNSMTDFYSGVGDAMDKPPDEFNKAADEQVAKLASGGVSQTLAKTLVPGLKRGRMTMAACEEKRAMLRTAIDILLQGESAVANSRDPYGSGPFGYAKTARGFDLTSQLPVDASKPERGNVKLVVGGQ